MVMLAAVLLFHNCIFDYANCVLEILPHLCILVAVVAAVVARKTNRLTKKTTFQYAYINCVNRINTSGSHRCHFWHFGTRNRSTCAPSGGSLRAGIFRNQTGNITIGRRGTGRGTGFSLFLCPCAPVRIVDGSILQQCGEHKYETHH